MNWLFKFKHEMTLCNYCKISLWAESLHSSWGQEKGKDSRKCCSSANMSIEKEQFGGPGWIQGVGQQEAGSEGSVGSQAKEGEDPQAGGQNSEDRKERVGSDSRITYFSQRFKVFLYRENGFRSMFLNV